MRDSVVIRSSVSPSAKYSCSGSPLMFWNGSTAMEGLSGSGSGTSATGADGASEAGGDSTSGADQSSADHSTRNARIGRAMFFIAQRGKSGFEPSLDSVAHGARNDDPTRGCFRLKPRGHIYRVTVDVTV